jgi:hypothetical protein
MDIPPRRSRYYYYVRRVGDGRIDTERKRHTEGGVASRSYKSATPDEHTQNEEPGS